MQLKRCFKCGEAKPYSEFYRHSGMADGHLGKCKECAKSDVKARRVENGEHVRAYDRKRGNRQTPEDQRRYRNKHPDRVRAERKVRWAVKTGVLVRAKHCSECGSSENIHGHHDDYSKPLLVRWLCALCHRRWHAENDPKPGIASRRLERKAS